MANGLKYPELENYYPYTAEYSRAWSMYWEMSYQKEFQAAPFCFHPSLWLGAKNTSCEMLGPLVVKVHGDITLQPEGLELKLCLLKPVAL